MTYLIIYDAVIKKTRTTPPNTFIGNVELAAAIGLVLEELQIPFQREGIEQPEDIKAFFLKQIDNVDKTSLSEQSRILIDLIEQYQVKKMVNEKLRNLLELCERKMEDSEV